MAALYTGTVDTPKGTVVVSYDQALVWQACAWTKPNAFCGGATELLGRRADERHMSDVLRADVVVVGSGVAGALTGSFARAHRRRTC